MRHAIAALLLGLPAWIALTSGAAIGQTTAKEGAPITECALPRSAVKAEEPVAVAAGEAISARDLDNAAAAQLLPLRNQEFQIRSKVLEDLIRQRIVEAEARKRNLTVEQFYVQEIDSKIPTPTDGEVAAYYTAIRAQLKEPFQDIKSKLRINLKALEVKQARQDYADSLRAKAEVSVMLHAAKIDVAVDRSRLRGDPDAPVTIVEFADYQCPYCQQTENTLNALLKKYPGKVNVAFRDFPLTSIHPYAQMASEAARCAGRQGKFWQFHDALFANQAKLDQPGIEAIAKTLGLDERPFQACMGSGDFKTQISSDQEDGRKAGVSSTPSFFINGVFLTGAQPDTAFEKLIEDELKAAGTRTAAAAR